jgi:hypothetical protein
MLEKVPHLRCRSLAAKLGVEAAVLPMALYTTVTSRDHSKLKGRKTLPMYTKTTTSSSGQGMDQGKTPLSHSESVYIKVWAVP